jgi:general secretion pathway protein D
MEKPAIGDASAGTITRTGRPPLTFEPTAPPANAAEAANQAASQMEQAVRNAGENPTPAAAAGGTAAGSPLQLSLAPQQSVHKVGSTFQMRVNLTGGKDVFSVPMQLHYDPKVLTLLNVDTGTLLGKDGQTTALAHRDDNGDVTISDSRPPGVHGVSGSGDVCVLTFQAKAAGDSSVQVIKSAARNSAQTILPILAGSPATVHVQ